MNRLELIKKLNKILLDEMPMYQTQAYTFPNDIRSQRDLLRSLMNIRPAMPLNPEFIRLQNELLSAEIAEKGVVDACTLSTTTDKRIVLWQGDITRLNADAIVNAANSQMLGCFVPLHRCIDNVIHSAAGLQLRDECNQIMTAQGHKEKTGSAKITGGYNLPCKHVIHTVGPIVSHGLNHRLELQLASCYCSCMELADKHGLESIAFCCISTGEFHFPNHKAAEIAIDTVTEMLDKCTSIKKVIFNVFKDEDFKIYEKLLIKK